MEICIFQLPSQQEAIQNVGLTLITNMSGCGSTDKFSLADKISLNTDEKMLKSIKSSNGRTQLICLPYPYILFLFQLTFI